MQHPVSQRIKILIDYYSGGNVSKFSAMLDGYTKQSINRLFNFDSRSQSFPTPSTELILHILEKFPNVNAGWLISGAGDMLKDLSVADVMKSPEMLYESVDWKSMYFAEKKSKEEINVKYITLLEKLASDK